MFRRQFEMRARSERDRLARAARPGAPPLRVHVARLLRAAADRLETREVATG